MWRERERDIKNQGDELRKQRNFSIKMTIIMLRTSSRFLLSWYHCSYTYTIDRPVHGEKINCWFTIWRTCNNLPTSAGRCSRKRFSPIFRYSKGKENLLRLPQLQPCTPTGGANADRWQFYIIYIRSHYFLLAKGLFFRIKFMKWLWMLVPFQHDRPMFFSQPRI
jgi:hypothetical protein